MMEINEENINKVVEVLRMGKLNESLLKVQDISKVAQQLMEQYPNLTPEEIGQKYEEQLALESNTNNINTESVKENDDSGREEED